MQSHAGGTLFPMTHTDTDDYVAQQAAGWIDIGQFHHEYDRNPAHLRPETADGPGATLALTEELRTWLTDMLRRNKIDTLLDAACGDWSWMRLVDLGATEYLGWDVDPQRISTCRQRIEEGDCNFSTCKPTAKFDTVNLLTVPEIPCVDLVLCRDFLMHTTNEYVAHVIDKVRASGSVLLLATTFRDADNASRRWDPAQATWQGYMEQAVDLTAPPFDLGEPIERFAEEPGPWGILGQPRELGLWRLNDPYPAAP
jgi:hypothetical protein